MLGFLGWDAGMYSHFIASILYINCGGEDIIVYDSHPMALGATPLQVFIDGVPQIPSPHAVPSA